ncbi:Uncharacterised protein at_DN1943 [Pycnogonum litorale]
MVDIRRNVTAIIPRPGLFLAFLSTLAFCVASMIIKHAFNHGVSAYQITLFYYSFQGVVSVISMIVSTSENVTLTKKTWILLILISTVKPSATTISIWSLSVISVFEVFILIHAEPIFVTVLSKCCLRGGSDCLDLLASFFIFCGVIVSSNPYAIVKEFSTSTDTVSRTFGMFGALSCAVLTSIYKIGIKHFEDFPATHFMLLQFISTIIIQFTLMIAFNAYSINLPITIWLYLICLGVLGYIARYLQIMALQLDNPVAVSVVDILLTPLSGFMEWMIFSTEPTVYAIIGSVIIILANVLVIVKSSLLEYLRGM